MNADSTITQEEFENADAVVAITYNPRVRGFAVHAEGNNMLTRPVLAQVLAAYALSVLEDEAAKN